jgi:hypothetical protein
LRADPAERDNVITESPAAAAEFRGRLLDLAARFGLGCRARLVATQPTVLRLRSSAPIRYRQIPVLSEENAMDVSLDKQELELRIERPETVLIVLGLEAGATLEVSGECGGRPLAASQVYLGKTGQHPPQVPFRVGSDVQFGALRSGAPPPGGEASATTLWLWRPRAEEDAEAPPPDVDAETRRQLRALGYVD